MESKTQQRWQIWLWHRNQKIRGINTVSTTILWSEKERRWRTCCSLSTQHQLFILRSRGQWNTDEGVWSDERRLMRRPVSISPFTVAKTTVARKNQDRDVFVLEGDSESGLTCYRRRTDRIVNTRAASAQRKGKRSLVCLVGSLWPGALKSHAASNSSTLHE